MSFTATSVCLLLLDCSVEYYVTKRVIPSDDSKFLCVLFSNACMARCCQGQAGETSVVIKCRNDALVSLTGQQLIVRTRLFGAVPWPLRDCQQCCGT